MSAHLVFLALFCAVFSVARAELYQFDVRGLPDTPKADKDGFSVVLVDSGSDVLVVQGVAAVPDSFGAIESAVLIVTDPAGRRQSRAVLLPQRLEGKFSNFEFDLRRDLLDKSVLVVSHRDNEDLHVAKFILGSFHVRNFKK
jgi:hypothetical protein